MSLSLFSPRVVSPADHSINQHQIITENCSISSSVSDNDMKLEKISLLTNRCPSLDSRLSTRFQRIDPDHVKSSVFQINKFETTSVVYLRCSIAICYGRIENCQEVNGTFLDEEILQQLHSSAYVQRYDEHPYLIVVNRQRWILPSRPRSTRVRSIMSTKRVRVSLLFDDDERITMKNSKQRRN